MLHKLIATLRKRGAHGRTFPVQATEATQAAEMIADLLRQRDALLEALQELRYAATDKAEQTADAAIAKATGETT